jgi:hypothetical protein
MLRSPRHKPQLRPLPPQLGMLDIHTCMFHLN